MANSLKMMKEKKLVLNEDTDKWGVGIMTMERFKAHPTCCATLSCSRAT